MSRSVSTHDLSVHRQAEYSVDLYELPISCKVIPVLLVLVFFVESLHSILAINVANLMVNYHVWSLWTCAIVENSWLGLASALVAIAVFQRYVEVVWGTSKYLKFLGIVLPLCSLCVLIIDYIGLMMSDEIFEKEMYHGYGVVIVSNLVALKQLIPNHELLMGFVLPIRFNDLPLVTVCFSIVLQFVFPSRGFAHMMFAFPVSWMYLRFIQGDRSSEFSLASFFPKPLQKLVNPLSVTIDRLSCWRQPVMSPVDSVETPPAISLAQRDRRALAAQLLNDRMSVGASSLPSPLSVVVEGGAQAEAKQEDSVVKDVAPTPVRKKE